jgi:hypothetical protein
MSQILFRTTKQDSLDKGKCKILFELVVHMKKGQADGAECAEMSCGWCSIDINDLSNKITRELPISGGNPMSEMAI